jgi:hypothetical protein
MEIKLEDICVWHINPSNEKCKNCKIDEDNYHCPDYLNRIKAIETYRPEEVSPTIKSM